MFPGFRIFGLFIGSYPLCITVGIFLAAPLAIVRYKKRGGSDTAMMFVFIIGGFGAALGMHLLYGLTNLSHFDILLSADGAEEFLKRLWLLFRGGVFYGGLLGGLLTGGIFIKLQKLPAGLVCDCAAPSIALFHAVGRVGCFLGGCCYGIESDYGITFTNALIKSANGTPRLPVQLYEAAFELVLFVVLSALLKKEALRGRLLAVYLIAYAAGRFLLEFLRGDEYRGFFLGLSTSQHISILVLVSAALWLILSAVINKQEKDNHNEKMD